MGAAGQAITVRYVTEFTNRIRLPKVRSLFSG
jgi:hypothetical protein